MGRWTERRVVNTTTDGDADGSVALLPLLDWISRQPDEIDLELACIEHPDPGRGPRGRTVAVVPGCLAQAAPHLLLELLVLGAASVTTATGGCKDHQLLRDRSVPLVALLERLGHADRLRVDDTRGRERRRPVLSATSMPVSRRQLFLLSEPERRPLPDTTATAHQRLVAAVRELASSASTTAATAPPVPEGPARCLTSQGCTGCGVCVHACPERALDIEVAADDGRAADPQAEDTRRHGAETTLWMQPSSCSGCRGCIDLCPTGALADHGPHDWDALLDDSWTALESLTTVVCHRCKGRFPAGDGQLCPVCAFRSAEPFGTTLPPEVLRRLGPDVARRLTERSRPV